MGREVKRVPMDYVFSEPGEEPPKGKGYQIWETVTEGSPVSPVFEKPEELAKWMVENDGSVTQGTSYEKWRVFIKEEGWAPSFVIGGGIMVSGVGAYQPKEKGNA